MELRKAFEPTAMTWFGEEGQQSTEWYYNLPEESFKLYKQVSQLIKLCLVRGLEKQLLYEED
jgi:hypothetical protein